MQIVKATLKDIDWILYFIKELAVYEKMQDEVLVTKDLIKKWIFEEKKAEVILLVKDKPIGFALYFNNYSTFVGKPGIYLEDIYIEPSERGKGYGKEVFKYLAKTAYENDYGRIEWSCLNWNKPSVDFYLSIGAKPMDEWTVFRLDKKSITKIMEGDL